MVAAHTACLLLSDVRLILTIPGREALPRAQPGGSEPGSRPGLWLQGSKAQLGDGMAIRLGSSKCPSHPALPGPQALLKGYPRWP